MKGITVRVCRCGCERKVYSGTRGRPRELCNDAVADRRRISSKVCRERNREAYTAYQHDYYLKRKAADPEFLKKRAVKQYARYQAKKGGSK